VLSFHQRQVPSSEVGPKMAWVVTGATAQKGGDLQIAGWDNSGVLSSTRGKELQSFYARLW
jgi:hypothetical protein